MLLCHDFADGIRNIIIFRKKSLQNGCVLNRHIAVAVNVSRVEIDSFKRFHLRVITLNSGNVVDVHHTVAVGVAEEGVVEEDIGDVLRFGVFIAVGTIPHAEGEVGVVLEGRYCY